MAIWPCRVLCQLTAIQACVVCQSLPISLFNSLIYRAIDDPTMLSTSLLSKTRNIQPDRFRVHEPMNSNVHKRQAFTLGTTCCLQFMLWAVMFRGCAGQKETIMIISGDNCSECGGGNRRVKDQYGRTFVSCLFWCSTVLGADYRIAIPDTMRWGWKKAGSWSYNVITGPAAISSTGLPCFAFTTASLSQIQ